MISGFEVNQSTSVKVRDTEKSGDILGGVGDLGVNNISGLNFTIEDEDALRREARAMAIKDAEEKAEELSKDLGVKILGIVNFYEQGNGGIYGRGGDNFILESSAVKAPSPEISVGENRIISTVNIVYAIK